ncbi:hypothetical protein SO802_011357 [Lithocarpus litseifolius]|uniref:Uncharacterized protein n=1 Tax=Lithocarpus litseifolius TaxID=425828 RepID=A0AAW2D3J8_9ROSI
MITGDNEHAARVIALECGIPNLDEDFNNEAVVEQGIFKKYSPEERTACLIHLVMAGLEKWFVNCQYQEADWGQWGACIGVAAMSWSTALALQV